MSCPCAAGAKPLDEKMLSQVMLQLLQNHSRGIPAAALLDKVKSDMCLDGGGGTAPRLLVRAAANDHVTRAFTSSASTRSTTNE